MITMTFLQTITVAYNNLSPYGILFFCIKVLIPFMQNKFVLCCNLDAKIQDGSINNTVSKKLRPNRHVKGDKAVYMLLAL